MPNQTKLRNVRQQRGYRTTSALAKAIGVTDVCVFYWENARTRPKALNAKRLEDVLQVPIETLLEIESTSDTSVSEAQVESDQTQANTKKSIDVRFYAV